jgi:hypothetical protein
LPACVSLVCRELEEARRLAVVLRQAATAGHIEDPEADLPVCISLVGGKLEEARRLGVVLRQAAKAIRIQAPQTVLPACVSLFCVPNTFAAEYRSRQRPRRTPW